MTTAVQRNFTEKEYQQLIKYAGKQLYDDWQALDSLARIQLNQTLPQVKRALWRINTGYAVLFPFATDAVEKLREEILYGFDLLFKEKKLPSVNQFYQLIEMYEAAIDVADVRLGIGEAIPLIDLMLGAASVKGVGLTASLRRLHQIKHLLDRMMVEAEFLKLEAQIQQAVGFAVNLFTLLPGVNLFAKGALTVADFVIDNKLGPDKQGIAGKIDDPVKAMNFVLDALEKSKSIGSKSKSFAGKAGKVMTVTGFAIDHIEVQQASELVDRIKKHLDEANKLYKTLSKDLDTEIAKVKRLEQEFKVKMEPAYRKADQLQRDRDDLMSQFQYPRIGQFLWQFEQPALVQEHR